MFALCPFRIGGYFYICFYFGNPINFLCNNPKRIAINYEKSYEINV